MNSRAILLAALLATTACTAGGDANNQAAQVEAPTIGIDLAGLNKQVRPGDDFDEYANGGWRARTEIPADRSSTGVFLEVFNKAEANNAAIVKVALEANAAAGTDQRRIADWYRAFTDTAGIEARGLAPLSGDLDAIARLSDKKALSAMLGGDVRADVDPLNATNFETENIFGIFVTQAFSQPETT
ncbi:MAG TPA: M13 family peptidase, partial [Sphingomonas sp.]|nr:M13 family peptidase [Sphingomonas sp.]